MAMGGQYPLDPNSTGMNGSPRLMGQSGPNTGLTGLENIDTTPLRVCAFNEKCNKMSCPRVHGFFDPDQVEHFKTVPVSKKALQMLCVHHMIGDCHDGYKCTYRHLTPSYERPVSFKFFHTTTAPPH